MADGHIYIALSLTAYLFWSLSNIFDKIVVDDRVVDPVSLAFFEILLSIFVFLLIPFVDFVLLPPRALLFSLLTGALFVLFVIPYFKALQREEVSRVTPLWRFYPIFTLIISHFTIGEKLNWNHYIAFVFLVSGGFLISVKKIEGVFRLTTAFWFMIVTTIITAVHDVCLKYIYKNLGAEFKDADLNVYLWVKIGSILTTLLFLTITRFRQPTFNMVRKLPRIKTIFALTSVFLSQIAMILFFRSVRLGSVSIVSALSGFENFFTLILAILFSLKWAQYFKEPLDWKTLTVKCLAICIIFIGLIFLYL